MLKRIHYAFALGVCTASIVIGGALGYFIFGPMGVSADIPDDEPEYCREVSLVLPSLKAAPEEPSYILTVSDGYIVVLGPDEEIKEKTFTPIDALPPEDQQRLEEGIRLFSEEELMRILEDYGS